MMSHPRSVATAPSATKETAVTATQNIFFWKGVGDMKANSRITGENPRESGVAPSGRVSLPQLTVHAEGTSGRLVPDEKLVTVSSLRGDCCGGRRWALFVEECAVEAGR